MGDGESKADDGHEREARQDEIRRAAAAPAGEVPEREIAAVDRPREHSDRHQCVEATATIAQACDADRDPEGERRQGDRNRPCRHLVQS